MPVFPVSKKGRPELQGSLLHARGLAAQTQPLARPRAAARRGFCPRNDVQQHRKVYEAWALHNGVSWLSGRERRSGRQRWGLGCILCAQYCAAGRKEKPRYCHSDRRFSKFAKFECRPSSRGMAKWLIEQHAISRSHRIATGQVEASGRRRKRKVDTPSPQACALTLSCPEFSHSEASLDRATEDDALLKGNVPSAFEWKDAWSLLSERCSLRAGGRIFEKKHGQAKAAPLMHKKRKRYRQQLRTMAELTRRRIREVLRQATSISLSLDEGKYRKIVRFRADLPSRQRATSGSLWRHVGASGFLRIRRPGPPGLLQETRGRF